jgi:hypothetical protein
MTPQSAALVQVALGLIAKGAIVYVGAVALSWGIVVALRRVPVIARAYSNLCKRGNLCVISAPAVKPRPAIPTDVPSWHFCDLID